MKPAIANPFHTLVQALLLITMLAPTPALALTHEEAQDKIKQAEGSLNDDLAGAVQLYREAIPFLPLEVRAMRMMRLGYLQLSPGLDLPPEIGTQSLLQGISLATYHEQWCWSSYGWRQLATRGMDADPPDIEQVSQFIDNAEYYALNCDPGSIDFDPQKSQHRLALGWVEQIRAELHRLEGDQPGELEALERALSILQGGKTPPFDALFRLAELRHDLGDVTDGGAAYDALLLNPALQDDKHLHLRINLRIARAAFEIDRGKPVDAIPYLEQVLQETLTLQGEEAFVSVAYAYLCLIAIRQNYDALATRHLEDMKLFAPFVLLQRQQGFLQYVEGEYYLLQGDTARARALFYAAQEAGEVEHELSWRALEALARVESMDGNSEKARAHVVHAIDEIEAQRRAMASDFFVLAYTSQREKLYTALLRLLVDRCLSGVDGTGSSGEDSRQPDAVRSASSLKGTPDDLLAVIEKRAAATLTAKWVADQGGTVGSSAENRTLWAQAIRQLTGEWSSGKALRAQLDPGQVCFVLQPLGDSILILEVRHDGTTMLPLVPYGKVRQEQLQQVIVTMRGEEPGIPPDLEAVGQWLLGPIWPRLPGPDVPTAFVMLDELATLPLSGLRVNGRFLMELTAPYHLPNLLSASLLPKPAHTTPQTVLGISGTPELTGATQQIALLEHTGLDVQTLTNPAWKEARDAMGTAAADLIVVATHANPPEQSAGGNSLERSEGREAELRFRDGPLTPSRLMGIKLNGARVVLSTCESLVGEHEFQEYSGALSRAFLVSGASSVLGSHWKVSDRATLVLMALVMDELTREGAGGAQGSGSHAGMALALARAQRRMLRGDFGSLPTAVREGLELSPTAQKLPLNAPYSWAGFSLVGRPD